LSLSVLLFASIAATQLAPRVVVGPDDRPTVYRDYDGTVACRSDAAGTFCISQQRETLVCDADGCISGTATEQDWTRLRAASERLPVHPYTEVWSGRYGGVGCVARETGGFDCRGPDGARASLFVGEEPPPNERVPEMGPSGSAPAAPDPETPR